MDYKSSLNSPARCYRWLRLPRGIKTASEISQRIINNILEGTRGAKAIGDDIIVVTKLEHGSI